MHFLQLRKPSIRYALRRMRRADPASRMGQISGQRVSDNFDTRRLWHNFAHGFALRIVFRRKVELLGSHLHQRQLTQLLLYICNLPRNLLHLPYPHI